MYDVSIAYSKQILSISREWDMYIDITLASGTTLRLTKRDISLGTPTLKEGATCSDTIQVGSTFSNSFEFTIVNDEGRFTDYDFYMAKVQPYVGLYVPVLHETTQEIISWLCEYVPLGEFWVLENVKRLSTIPIICFDSMSRANRLFDFSSLVFPTDCSTILSEVVKQCNFVVSDSLVSEVAQLNYSVGSLLTNDPTCRDILAGLGVMLCKNLRFDRRGVLESFWYSQSDAVDFDGSVINLGATSRVNRVGNSSYGDNQVTITGVYLEDAYGNTFSAGTDEFPVELPTSPILQGSDMCQPILEAALSTLQAVAHRPASISYSGDPAVQAGDLLVHRDTSVGDLVLPVMRLIYKFAGIGTLESLGVDSATQHQESATDRRLKKAFLKSSQDRSELETKIDQTEREVLIQASEQFASKSDLAELSVSTEGIASRVSHQEYTIVGIQTDLNSMQATSTELTLQFQQIVDNGVDKVTTSTGFTFDQDGLRIQKSGEEIENKLDHTGMYVTRSGETILQANNEGVVATDVTVRNYLMVGSHARFEDYNNGTDRARTACFWIP